MKAAGIDDADITNTDEKVAVLIILFFAVILLIINPQNVRKQMKEHFDEFLELVDADWHDGYEDQSEELDKWFGKSVQPVLISVSFL